MMTSSLLRISNHVIHRRSVVLMSSSSIRCSSHILQTIHDVKNIKNQETTTRSCRFLTSLTTSTTTTTTTTNRSSINNNRIDKHESLIRPFSTGYSSMTEPEPTQFFNSMNKVSNIDDEDWDAPLRTDIRVMGSLLGSVIAQHDGSDLLNKVETMRLLAKKWRETHDDSIFQQLIVYASALKNDELFSVSRAFTHFLAIVNSAERHHRSRRIKQITYNSMIESGALHPKNDSVGGAIPYLLKLGVSVDDIYNTITTQTTELVLTAHPTEVNRRTILDKNRRIQTILDEADQYRFIVSNSDNNMKPKKYDMEKMHHALANEISSIWLSDEVSRSKPTVEQEAEKGTLVLETVLWQSVPQYLRKLDATMTTFLGKRLPLTSAPIKFASWMGGDRDGNPNVQPNTTRIVCMKNRMKAAELFYYDVRQLRNDLSIRKANDELCNVIGSYNEREPYRTMLERVLTKLDNTRKWAEQELIYIKSLDDGNNSITNSNAKHIQTYNEDEIYVKQNDFHNDLMIVYKSLYDTGNELTADGFLTDILRNISAFGLTLIPLDVRQESGKHEDAIDAITRFLGLGSFKQWDEQTKINWLITQISNKRPLIRPGTWYKYPDIFTPTVIDTLEIFQMISEQHEGSLGAYVISQATTASDVLSVLLLQIDAGVTTPLRIAPLFETLSDLQGAYTTMKSLFSLSTYMGIINGKQEVMIGYSDSAKDAGRLAASWAQYITQVQLSELAKEYNIKMTFFHGKGGTVGRGGNPQTFYAIMAHAPNTINGYFRVTEQGEMINQNFGFPDIAERTLDIYTAAVLSEKLTPRTVVKDSWKNMMDELSDISCDEYRQVVREDKRFVPYFREATPDFSNLNIGSRPAKRNPTGGVESLRAIPWNFAWTQTRLNLPTWLGVGNALNSKLNGKPEEAALIREMYNEWDTFRTIVDLVEMVLAKSEPSIAKHYEDVLVKGELAKELGKEVRLKHIATENAIKDVTGHQELAENNTILTRALKVKNPYVDCLNILQAETVQRMRKDGDISMNDPELKDALTTTITGLANGIGNTG